ncbi:FUSC family protein [Bordetella sp. 2513F-2]
MSWLTRLRSGQVRAPVRESLRVPLQTIAAVLCAYFAMRLLALPEQGWAAFSALFVVRASMEGTVGEAGARILGALVGVAIGVVLALLHRNGWPAVMVLSVGIGLMSAIATRWPILSYGLVTVAMLTVEPDPDILDGAWDKICAIAVGSTAGAAAGLAIFPLSARRLARANLADSLESLGEVAEQCLATFIDHHAKPRETDYSTMEPASESARRVLMQARVGPLRRLHRVRAARALQERVDSLWRVLPILDHATSQPLSAPACQAMAESLECIARAFREDTSRLADCIRRERGDDAELAAASACREAFERAARAELDGTDRQALQLARWAWEVMLRETRFLQQSLPAR